jgi:hypothetical protein
MTTEHQRQQAEVRREAAEKRRARAEMPRESDPRALARGAWLLEVQARYTHSETQELFQENQSIYI